MEKKSKSRWQVVKYSKSQIVDAGSKMRHPDISDKEALEAKEIIDNWRASHAYPLHACYMILRRQASGTNYIVAERLKRLESIINKLRREKNMNLWTMQDLGGCRYIVTSVEKVYAEVEKFKISMKNHEQKGEGKDYIKSPKKSGYRGIHLVYKFNSKRKQEYNKNMMIEFQFRTHIQHLWATAVETYDLLAHESIKSGDGNTDVKRFFALVSHLFALKEQASPVPGVEGDKNTIIEEMNKIDSENHIIDTLTGFRAAIPKIEEKGSFGYCVIVYNFLERKLKLHFYKQKNFNQANKLYKEIEDKKNYDENIDAVLVRADSYKSLKTAYPNYFGNIERFLSMLDLVCK